MKWSLKNLSLLLGLLLLTVQCSTLKKLAFKHAVNRAKDKQATQVNYTPPANSYKKTSHPELDALWVHQDNKSSISYLSSCSQISQPLESLQKDILSQLKDYKIIKTTHSTNSIYLIIQANQARIGLYILKKGNCSYTLNFTAPSLDIFNQELAAFNQFINSFKPQ